MNDEILMTEEQLGEFVREACRVMGWNFKWLRKVRDSSAGILDLLLIPTRHVERRHILHRELKGFDKNGRLGELTADQEETITDINFARGDAKMWAPADWLSNKILDELK